MLPFANASGDPNTEYLSDGITESLINNLSQLPNLREMARSTVFRYKGKEVDPQKVGQDLRVSAVLSGRLLQQGDTLIVRAELMNVAKGSQLWGSQYNRKLGDILMVQEDIAKDISEKLRLKLTGEEKKRLAKRYTENPEAYQLYLKGRYYSGKFTQEGLNKGFEYFRQAIDLDPGYALPYTGLAYSYFVVGDWYLSPRETMPKAREAALKSLELDETLGEGHLWLATTKFWYDWDWPGAEREYKRALELSPSSVSAHQFYGFSLAWMGRVKEAIEQGKRAVELDPLSLEANAHWGLILYWGHRYDQAIDQLRKTVDIDPNFYFAHLCLGRAYEHNGKKDDAIVELERARQIENPNPEGLGELGYAYAMAGMRDKAEKVLDKLKQRTKRSYVPAYALAQIYAGLGERERAFEWLARAYEDRSFFLMGLNVDPDLDTLRSDRRFIDLVRRIGLPPQPSLVDPSKQEPFPGSNPAGA